MWPEVPKYVSGTFLGNPCVRPGNPSPPTSAGQQPRCLASNRAAWGLFFLLLPLGIAWGWEGDRPPEEAHGASTGKMTVGTAAEPVCPAPPHPHAGEAEALAQMHLHPRTRGSEEKVSSITGLITAEQLRPGQGLRG